MIFHLYEEMNQMVNKNNNNKNNSSNSRLWHMVWPQTKSSGGAFQVSHYSKYQEFVK